MTEPSPKETLDTVSSEMQRRMRAMLAMVRSLTRRTARNAQSVEEFEQHLDGRLLALGRAQAFVMPGDEKRFDLELLVREEMLAYLQKDNGLITIEGGSAALPARLAEAFVFVVHELLTNSIKFGALGASVGQITISWRTITSPNGESLDFRWEEKVPHVTYPVPVRRGFGCELLEEVMRYEHGASPKLQFEPDGMTYSVQLKL